MTPEQRIAALEAEVATLRDRLAGHGGDEFLAAALAAVPAFIIRYDADLRLRYINRIQPGLRREEVIGAYLYDFMPPEHREIARRHIDRALATGESSSFEVVGTGPDGGLSIYETFVAPVAEPDGRRSICLVAVDVTAIRRHERELRDSEERLRLALEASGVGLWGLDVTTGEVMWDARMKQMMGRDEPIDLERYLAEAVHPDDRAWMREMSAGNLTMLQWQTPPHRIVRPDGEVRWMTSSGRIELDQAGKPARVVGGNLDVTAQRVAEEQLRHAQRLDAMGRLTAGVAHNFNNMLTVVTSNLDLLRRRHRDGDLALLDDARTAALRGAEMIRQLMTFTGQRPQPERRARPIDDLLDRLLAFCRRTFDRHIVLEDRRTGRLPPVVCSEGDVEQIALNLLLNARDAVLASERDAPRIAVEAELAPPPGDPGGAPGLRLRVIDDGVGMAPSVAAHAFEPFFTTKPVGQGTGLGLATSYAIAGELGGSLSLDSAPGRGSTFTLWLPASEGASATPPTGPAASRPLGARILLVDDEAQIRQALSALLEGAGFAAETAASGAEAVDRLRRTPPVDLVLLDRSMPGAPGDSFLPEIRQLAPAARVALFTGQAVEAELASRVDAVIAKPVAADDLFAAVHDLLAR
jgi:PAS domain S-box-containing protein